MARNVVAFLLLIYVALDFANPLMPGAVTFADGSVEMVPGDRERPTVVVPVDPALTSEPVVTRGLEAPRVARSPAALVRRPGVIRIRRAPLPSSRSSGRPEDH
jgi:hypothetical protein